MDGWMEGWVGGWSVLGDKNMLHKFQRGTLAEFNDVSLKNTQSKKIILFSTLRAFK